MRECEQAIEIAAIGYGALRIARRAEENRNRARL
jgi:hypothetical protein